MMMDRIKAEEVANVNNTEDRATSSNKPHSQGCLFEGWVSDDENWTYVAAPLTSTAGSLYVVNVYNEDNVLVGTVYDEDNVLAGTL